MILARDDANNDTLTINCHMVYFNVLEIFIPPMMSREIQPIITNLNSDRPFVSENQVIMKIWDNKLKN